jgi:hypothetical protein
METQPLDLFLFEGDDLCERDEAGESKVAFNKFQPN